MATTEEAIRAEIEAKTTMWKTITKWLDFAGGTVVILMDEYNAAKAQAKGKGQGR